MPGQVSGHVPGDAHPFLCGLSVLGSPLWPAGGRITPSFWGGGVASEWLGVCCSRPGGPVPAWVPLFSLISLSFRGPSAGQSTCRVSLSVPTPTPRPQSTASLGDLCPCVVDLVRIPGSIGVRPGRPVSARSPAPASASGGRRRLGLRPGAGSRLPVARTVTSGILLRGPCPWRTSQSPALPSDSGRPQALGPPDWPPVFLTSTQ